MKKITLILLIASSLLLSCARIDKAGTEKKQARIPQSTHELVDKIDTIVKELNDETIFNAETCDTYIKSVTDYLYLLPTGYFYPKNEVDQNYLLEFGPKSYYALFDLQTLLQKRISSIANLSPRCIHAAREGIRVSRYVLDSLGEWLYLKKVFPSNEMILSEIGTQTLVNQNDSTEPFTGMKDLKSGDVLLMRGETFVSAMIARIGDDDASFSHLAIVGNDDKGKLYLIEALIEVGTKAVPLDKWFANKKETRFVVYRNKDQDLAKRAGQQIYSYVKEKLKKDRVIPYDFTMNPEDHSQLFCSEVVKLAYQLASGNKINLPRTPTTFYDLKNSYFLNEMGIKVLETFSPADIELDSNFYRLAEYRNFSSLRKTRLQDAMMSSLFAWISNKDYELTDRFNPYLMSSLAKFVRTLGFAPDKMQKHMPREVLSTVIKLNNISAIIEDHLFKYEQIFFDKKGYSYTYKDLMDHLEVYRRADCKRFWNIKMTDEENLVVLPARNVHEHIRGKDRQCD